MKRAFGLKPAVTTWRTTGPAVAWLLTVCTALALLGDATFYVVLPGSFSSLNLVLWQVGWLLSINRLARIPLNLVSGAFSDHFGSRTPFIVGMTLGAISTLGYGLVQGFWPLLVFRVMWGAAWALLVVSAYGLILNTTDEEQRGRWTGFYASASFFGGAIGAMLGGYLIDVLDFDRGMLILGAATCVGAAMAWLVPKVEPKRPQDADALSASIRGADWRSMLAIAGRFDTRVWLILALNVLHRFFFAGVFYATIGLYLREHYGQSVTLAGATIGIVSLTGTLMFGRNLITMLVGPLGGWISDLLRDRVGTLIVGEVCGALGLVALAVGGGGAPALMLGVALAAMAWGIVPPMLVSWLGDLCPSDLRGRAVGAYQMAGDLGSGLGPLVVYALVDALGLSLVYGLCGAVLAAMIPVIVFAHKRLAR